MAKSARFTIESLMVSNVTDKGFHLDLKQKFGTVSVPMHTKGFVATVFDMQGSTLFNLQIPTFSGTSIHLKQEVEIVDMKAYQRFAASLLDQAVVQQRMFGTASVTILGRNLQLHLNKTLSVRSLRDLRLDIDSVITNQTPTGTFSSSTNMTYKDSQVSLNFGLTNFTVDAHDLFPKCNH